MAGGLLTRILIGGLIYHPHHLLLSSPSSLSGRPPAVTISAHFESGACFRCRLQATATCHSKAYGTMARSQGEAEQRTMTTSEAFGCDDGKIHFLKYYLKEQLTIRAAF